MHDIKIYFINLDRSTERRKFMEEQLDKFGISYIRIPAVDGQMLDALITKPIYARLQEKNEHYTLPKAGEIGIYLTYMDVWRKIADQEEKFALILEDDVLIDEKLFEDINLICQNVSSSEIVDFSGKKGFWASEKKSIIDKLSITHYSTCGLGFMGTMIGKIAAQKLIDTFPAYTMPVDNMKQLAYKHKIPIWTTNRAYVKHHSENLGGSTIQIKDHDLKTKLRREFLRPFYRTKTIIMNLLCF
ncbi:MAG: glycosyltransferase family 25 protein [Sulfurovaceae bacterium]|nr:glycosyltransferase family 25 protein [Sulfurovaceae bacterium]